MMNRLLAVWRWKMVLLVLPGFLAACGAISPVEITNVPLSQPSPKPQMEQTMTVETMTEETMTDTAVSLQADAQIVADTLVVTYQVTNGLDETIYLVNRIFQWTADGLSLDANLIYTDKDGETVRLIKALLPVPEDLDVESPIVPFLTAVPAGKTFSETVTLPLPLMPYDPYDQLRPTDQATSYESVRFVVGWFEEGQTAVTSQNRPDGTTLLSAEYGAVEAVQKLLQTTWPMQISASIR